MSDESAVLMAVLSVTAWMAPWMAARMWARAAFTVIDRASNHAKWSVFRQTSCP